MEMRSAGQVSANASDAAPPAPLTERKGRVRPMEMSDIPAVGKLFNCIFRRNDVDANAELHRYLETAFFTSPLYAPEYGSMIHENAAGEVDSAVLSIPMQFRVGDRKITARLLCAFMAKGKSGALGAAHLARTLRAKRQDFCFSDNASPVSADHWEAGGGHILPIQSMEWRRVFRPFASGLQRLFRVIPAAGRLPLRLAAAPFDLLARRFFSSFTPAAEPGYRVESAELEEFRQHADRLLQRFSVRPVWSEEEFSWLVGLAAKNTSCGTLNCRKVLDRDEETIGAVLYFGQPKGIARVLNIICEKGREREFIEQICAFFNAEGYCDARGMAQPFLMKAIMRQRQLTFKHSGYFCLTTRHPEIVHAALHDDIYVGGLASESWSNLVVSS
ncbi:GNAT family N-acetyltransferase [Chelativorans sp. AA-79]|uniref:GNAT family N-acetyltransferase n=1 Tax=Chelativorans sp. AA-79 TaxID=3028735 RepID=UPI0023F7D8C0|nr:GNAT family N-acetyltransferase [Chelativorans sp. AA-79]WEX11819.1 GNAT family N-acetyltransferase [Chelativorans sp. AA-79]